MAPQWILRGGSREQRAGQRLRSLDTRLLFHCRRGIDVVLLWAGTGADSGGENLLKSLGGGDFFDGFEILWGLSVTFRGGLLAGKVGKVG